mmetsp:Transcript_31135/g.72488  ORF Transcript_31135/g.72488 Transcript_31135/m.72488 type:complete len:476 (+) Transcript_31135:82-1509(+)
MSRLSVSSLFSKPKPQSKGFSVGGSYKVVRDAVLWDTVTLTGTQVSKLRKGSTAVIINIDKDLNRALLVPLSPDLPGWVSLATKTCPLDLYVLPSSWEVGGRYSVEHQVTLRSTASLSSDYISELDRGREVIIIELGLDSESSRRSTAGTEGRSRPRLRARVSCCDDDSVVGWLSPLTADGETLLQTVNLHTAENVAEARYRTRASMMAGRGSVRDSIQKTGNLPWEVGGQYRALEPIDVSSDRGHGSKLGAKSGRIKPGTLVTVGQLQLITTESGILPVAMVHIPGEGKRSAKSGWIHCTTKDERELLDTRNLREYDKIVKNLEQEKQQPRSDSPKVHGVPLAGAYQASPTNDGEDEGSQDEDTTSDTDEASSSGSSSTRPEEMVEPKVPASAAELMRPHAAAESSSPGSSPSSRAGTDQRLFRRKMHNMDTEKEERITDESRTVTESSASRCCWCSCVQLRSAAPVDTIGTAS